MAKDGAVTVRAHAKVNLFLSVVGRRPDGYHELESVMQQLAMHDEMAFSPAAPGISLAVEGDPDVPADERNLVFRAAATLAEAAGIKPAVRICLRKLIPSSAGLGGGSADAAAALAALNGMWDLGWPLSRLMELAACIGSDVPFALFGGTALARGRGEVLESLPSPGALGVLLVKPPFGVSTAAVYAGYDEQDFPPGPGAGPLVEALRAGRADLVPGLLYNDLEKVTLAMYPVLSRLKERLLAAGAAGALMAGSGPTLFGLFPSRDQAAGAAEAFPDPDLTVWVTETI
ncbi:MAG: 4-(cytidine 5'-diphospho)-2-C-methyl-D-erythritol kinase [Bacillota bacterium]|nr:4-(cytidine 5'-diphospho)-2-C-methyl-D-erythritol kinase [Bacillota bacterium]